MWEAHAFLNNIWEAHIFLMNFLQTLFELFKMHMQIDKWHFYGLSWKNFFQTSLEKIIVRCYNSDKKIYCSAQFLLLKQINMVLHLFTNYLQDQPCIFVHSLFNLLIFSIRYKFFQGFIKLIMFPSLSLSLFFCLFVCMNNVDTVIMYVEFLIMESSKRIKG
jgi:hypothetical protein